MNDTSDDKDNNCDNEESSVEQDLDCNIDIIENTQDVQSASLITVLSFSRNRMLGYVDPSDPSLLDSLRLSCNSFQYNEENLKSLSSSGLPSRVHRDPNNNDKGVYEENNWYSWTKHCWNKITKTVRLFGRRHGNTRS